MRIEAYNKVSETYGGSRQRMPVPSEDFQEQLSIRKQKAQMIKEQTQRNHHIRSKQEEAKSDGTSKLTDKQISYLKEKYDVEDLSTEEYYGLLSELVSMNVISDDDFKQQFIKQAPPEIAEYGAMIVAGSPYYFGQEYKDYLDKFLKDCEMYEYYFRTIKDGKSSVHESNWVKTLEYYEKQKELGKRMADIFQMIKRE